jgi:hypothetical protein
VLVSLRQWLAWPVLGYIHLVLICRSKHNQDITTSESASQSTLVWCVKDRIGWIMDAHLSASASASAAKQWRHGSPAW